MAIAPESLELPVRRAKLRPPRPGAGLVARPRLTARLDESVRFPLTLVAAPAGFGKTTLLVEWAANHPQPVAWLTLDANDRQLARCVSHVVAAIDSLVPGIADPVLSLLRQPHQVAAADVGDALADALLNLPRDILLIVDDYQFAASGDVEHFLGGVLRIPPPSFHLLLATRIDPALPLARMRLQGQVNEVRAADLRFSDEEARALLRAAGNADMDPAAMAELQRQTGGWIAGLRLAALALPAVAGRARVDESIAAVRPLMDFLVEEVLAAQPAATQRFLLSAAPVDRVSPSLADALLDQPPPEGSRALLDRLNRESLFLEPVDEDGEWFRFHPLFRSLLRHQMEIRFSPAETAALHIRASDWFAAHGSMALAIQHRLTAGDTTGTADLVERHVATALDREDWNSVAAWLGALPEPVVHERPALLLAKCWVSHFSGRAAPVRAMLAELNELLAAPGFDPAARAAFEAERDALAMAAIIVGSHDGDAAVSFARRAVERVSPNHRLAAGLATFWLGCALQAAGRTDQAIRFLTAAVERDEGRVDAGSIRALGGLAFVHRQAGNIPACEDAANQVLTLAHRHDLPVAAGWARWMLGWLAYDRDELDTAIERFAAVVSDVQRVHFHGACEAMFGLALAYHAKKMPAEAESTVRRLLELILDVGALEYLPLLRAFEARLALVRGDPQRAISWLEMEEGLDVDCVGIDVFDHPYLTRVKALLAEGSPESLEQAWRAISAFLAVIEERRHGAHRVEALALAALVLDARGLPDEALEAMGRSVALAAMAKRVRTYLDLGPAAATLLGRLAARNPEMPFPRVLIEAFEEYRVGRRPGAASDVSVVMGEILTAREAEVLQGLARRLSYQEIGDELFISMETVKTHAARIYGKLQVSGRREALAKAAALGWLLPN